MCGCCLIVRSKVGSADTLAYRATRQASRLSHPLHWCSLQRLCNLLTADFLLCLWIDSNASFPRLKAASTRFGSAVRTKGFGVELVSARNRLIATWRSMRERKTPRLRRRLVSLAKKPSTALSQDAEVGVKWNAQRGCRAGHLRGIMAQTPQRALKVPRALPIRKASKTRRG
jgi:hypothetical protein